MRNLKTIIPIYCVVISVCFFAAGAYAETALKDGAGFFQHSVLSEWKGGLTSEDTLPYVSERIQAEFLWAARSPSGSYIFVTLTDHTTERPSLTAEELSGLVSKASFQVYNPEAFEKNIEPVRVKNTKNGEEITLDTFKMMVQAKGSGSDFQSDKKVLTTARSVFFPIVLQKGEEFLNYLVMADYRGESSNTYDAMQFDTFCKTFGITAEDYQFVRIDEYNAMQPKLATGPEAEDKKQEERLANLSSTPMDGEKMTYRAIVDIYE